MSGGLAGLLRARAETNPDVELLRFVGGASLTVAEVDRRTDRIGAALVDLGVGFGDRVAVQAGNTPTLPLLWFAAAKIGAVVVPINAGYRDQDLRHVLDDSGAAVLVLDDGLAESGEAAARDAASVRVILTSSELTHRSDVAPPMSAASVDDDTLVSLQYTSGTTGLPKACMLTQGYWVQLGRIAAQTLALSDRDVVLTAQAFTYMDPQWSLAMCLEAGVPLVVLPRFSASTFWDAVVEQGVTTFYVVGAMATMLLRQPPREADREHGVRLVVSSGIPPALHADLEARWGVPWREAFGMTETGVDLVVPIDDAGSVGTGDLGVPVATKRVRVVTETGDDAAPGEQGELIVAGQPMMLGYWNRPAETAETLRGGWLHTGDLAVYGPEGRLRVVGRLKDMVRRAGENVSAAEVENALVTHPDVIGAAVIAAPDDVRGEEVAAVVALRAGVVGDADLAEGVRQVVRNRLAPFKVPRYVVFVDSLPKTSSEKVAKSALVADWPRLRSQAHDNAGSTATDVRYGVVDGIATITLTRPEVLNAIRHRTLVELTAAVAASAADPRVRVLVITGEGRGFCAGQDLEELADRLRADDLSDPDDAARAARLLLDEFQQLTRLLLAHPRPTIAAVNGVAVGAGAELAVACDIRLAADTARIGFVEAARGLFQTNGVTWLLPRILGLSKAMELLVTADVVDADEAVRIGLVARVSTPESFPADVAAFAMRIAANAPLSVGQAVGIVRSTFDHSIDEAMALEVAATARCMASSDLREGTAAFHEGRVPSYEGT
jgi:acyl-CoA synthetase (AMP-forming)/AMP-acid ligase II/enoyl-CoA hydratase/carnithine racemase